MKSKKTETIKVILTKMKSVQEKLLSLEKTNHQCEEQELLLGNDLANDRKLLNNMEHQISQLDGQLTEAYANILMHIKEDYQIFLDHYQDKCDQEEILKYSKSYNQVHKEYLGVMAEVARFKLR